jgi:nucleotide-binding universal stress UspA family protein
MIDRVLVVVEDSTGGLAAGRAGIEICRGLGAQIRGLAIEPADRTSRPSSSVADVLAHLKGMCRQAGVSAETVQARDDPAQAILAHALDFGAELIVIGRSDDHGTGQPFISPYVQRVLEFSDVPVMVVPPMKLRS